MVLSQHDSTQGSKARARGFIGRILSNGAADHDKESDGFGFTAKTVENPRLTKLMCMGSSNGSRTRGSKLGKLRPGNLNPNKQRNIFLKIQ